MRKLLFTSLIAIFFIFNGFSSTNNRKTVKVGYMNAYNFQEGSSDSEVKGGYSYEYLQQIAANTGWKYEYVYASWQDCFQMLVEGKIDIMSGLSYTPERSSVIDFSELPIAVETYHIFIPESEKDKYPNSESLRGKSIGVGTGTLTSEYLKRWNEKNHFGIKIVEYEGLDTRIEALKNREIDALADLGNQIKKGSGLIPATQFGTENSYIGVNKNRPDILSQLNAAISKITITAPHFTSYLQEKYFSNTAIVSTLSSEEYFFLSKHPVIKVGVLEHSAPFIEALEYGQGRGLFCDILDYSFQRLGLDIYFDYKSYEDLSLMIRDLQNGTIDIATPYYESTWNSEQNNLLESVEVLSSPVNIISAKDIEITEDTIFAAVNNVSSQENFIKKNYPKNRIYYFKNYDEAFKAIKKGYVDATILDAYKIAIYLKRNNSFKISSLPFESDLSFAINPDCYNLLSIINMGISTFGYVNMQTSILRHTDEAYKPSFSDYIQAHYIRFILFSILFATVFSILIFYALSHRKQSRILEFKARIDDMTGLFNRRAYEEELQKYEGKSLPSDFIAAVLDINGLKRTNDNLGHSAGDELIAGLADCIKKTGSEHGFTHLKTFRTGGDEFTILGFDVDKIYDKAMKLFLEKADVWKGIKVKKLSVSYGYVRSNEYPQASLSDLLQIADNRMYKNKEQYYRVNFINQNSDVNITNLFKPDADKQDVDMFKTIMKVYESEYDHTTGLSGMSYFSRSIPIIKTEIEVQGVDAILICLRLANLNEYNTNKGIQAGNELIIAFASILAQIFGKKNCARSGGNEMVACTANINIEERLQLVLSELKQIENSDDIVIEAGTYLFKPEQNLTAETVLKLARANYKQVKTRD